MFYRQGKPIMAYYQETLISISMALCLPE